MYWTATHIYLKDWQLLNEDNIQTTRFKLDSFGLKTSVKYKYYNIQVWEEKIKLFKSHLNDIKKA